MELVFWYLFGTCNFEFVIFSTTFLNYYFLWELVD